MAVTGFAQMTEPVLERALDVKLADHLGYDVGDPASHGSGNSHNGHGRKRVLITVRQRWWEKKPARSTPGRDAPMSPPPSAVPYFFFLTWPFVVTGAVGS
jgi:hypothetical protein